MAAPESQPRADRDPIGPLTHPLRRRILRYLHSDVGPQGTREVANALGQELAQINYHLKSLLSYGTIRETSPALGVGSCLYESAVSENPEVLALLDAHADDDEGRKAA